MAVTATAAAVQEGAGRRLRKDVRVENTPYRFLSYRYSTKA